MVFREAFTMSLFGYHLRIMAAKISFRIVCWQVKYLTVDGRQK